VHSRRDLPIVLARCEDGANDVAHDDRVAPGPGIPQFLPRAAGIAAGTRGAVRSTCRRTCSNSAHAGRGGCSPAQNHLDLPLTLEVLERLRS